MKYFEYNNNSSIEALYQTKNHYRNLFRQFSYKSWRFTSLQLKNKTKRDLLDWVLDPRSTTEKFRKLKKKLKIQVIFQGKDYLYPPEMKRFGYQAQKNFGWVREVAIFLDEALVMIARTVVPLEQFYSRQNFFKFLKGYSLGDWLFKYLDIKRSPFEFSYNIDELSKIRFLGRRSIFTKGKHCLLLTEYFLHPHIPRT